MSLFYDIPSFRGWDGTKYVHWTSADAVPGGVSDITKMPLQGISGSVHPYEIPDLIGWYRADYGITIEAGLVTRWQDLSGNRFHAGQVTATGITLTASSYLNNKPAVEFDGTSILTASYNSKMQSSNMTVFIAGVIGRDASPAWATYQTFVSRTSSGGWSDGWALGSRDTSEASAFWFDGYTNYVQKAGYTNLPTKLIGTGRAGSNIIFRSNRYSAGTAAMGSTAATTADLIIGGAAGGYTCNGLIAEIFIYRRALTDSEMNQVEQYLVVKYGQGNQ